MDEERRKTLSFKQAEGLEPLPSQLAHSELSPRLRSFLWMVLHAYLDYAFGNPYQDSSKRLADAFRAEHFVRRSEPVDEFEWTTWKIMPLAKGIILDTSYEEVYDFLQFILRSLPRGDPRDNMTEDIKHALEKGCAGLILIEDGPTFVPISNEHERAAVAEAHVALREAEMSGASSHMRKAAEALSAGKAADAIRESIHAVEAVARRIDPGANLTLAPALKALRNSSAIHPAMEEAFRKLYGYTNDSEGIRHPLVGKDTPTADMTDAMFMHGACAAFISYLIGKGRATGLLEG